MQDGYGNYTDKLRTMMNLKAPRLVVDLNDLREYDSSFTDPATAEQENIVNRCVSKGVDWARRGEGRN